MANQWLRLWHDMPNDPKWRTVARASGRSISEVMAIYCHLLVMASSNPERGHVAGVTNHDMSRENVTNVTNVTCHEINFLEGISTSLDLEIEHVEAILEAMQGRLLEGGRISGWDSRQPQREDAGGNESGPKSNAQRKRDQRERDRLRKESSACHDKSRNVTTDKDKDKEYIKPTPTPRERAHDPTDPRIEFAMADDWVPGAKTFPGVLLRLGVPGDQFCPDQLQEFRSFWLASPDEHRNQAKWEHALGLSVKTQLRKAQASGRSTHGQPKSPNCVAGPDRPRQRSLSVPELVEAAIAEQRAARAKECDSAEYPAARRALGDHGPELRPPLDVEFWRASEAGPCLGETPDRPQRPANC